MTQQADLEQADGPVCVRHAQRHGDTLRGVI